MAEIPQHPNTFHLRYSVKYNTKNPVPLTEIIASLQSLDVLLKDAKNVLSLLTDVDISGQAIYIERIESGSLFTDVVLMLWCEDKEATERVMQWIENNKMKSILSILVGAGLVLGYQYLTNEKTNATVTTTTTITDSVIINGSDALSPELQKEIDAAIEQKMSQQRSKYAKATMDFVAPIRAEPDADISMGVDGQLMDTLNPEAIKTMPSAFEARKNQRFQSMTSVQVDLRATDIDKRTSGWAGTITGTVDTRVPIVLDPTLEPNALHGRISFKADVEVERTFRQSANQMIPTKIIVRKIY